MKIRMLVGGHTTQTYSLDFAKEFLLSERVKGNLVIDDETNQLAKIEGLTEESSVTVFPRITSG